MAPTPSIFTQTPIEALIQQSGLEAQGGLTSVMVGTAVFFGAASLMFLIRAGNALYRSGMGHQDGRTTAFIILKAWIWVVLGWFLLGYQTSSPIRIGPIENRSVGWDELPGVAANPSYSDLQDPVPAVYSYGLINGTIEEITGILQGAVSDATGASNPAESILGLMQLQATSLGAGHAPVASSFAELARSCADVEGAKVYGRGASAQGLFDLDKEGCGAKWNNFHEAYLDASDVILDQHFEFNNGDVMDVVGGYSAALGDPEKFENFVMSTAMEHWIADQAGRTATNSRRQVDATFSDGVGDAVTEAYMDGAFGEFLLYMTDLMPGTADPHAAAAKAEAANKFNEYADLIPTLRGFLHAMFAVFYPLAAFGVALGWTRPMIGWLAGRLTLGLYTPAATLLYQMTDRLTQQSAMVNNPDLSWVGTDQFVFGGALLLESEITRIQTSYLMCEGAVFTGFLIGSATLLRGGLAARSHINSRVEAGAQAGSQFLRSTGVLGSAVEGTKSLGRSLGGHALSGARVAVGVGTVAAIGVRERRAATAAPPPPAQLRRLGPAPAPPKSGRQL